MDHVHDAVSGEHSVITDDLIGYSYVSLSSLLVARVMAVYKWTFVDIESSNLLCIARLTRDREVNRLDHKVS